jgi:hypothetical protein
MERVFEELKLQTKGLRASLDAICYETSNPYLTRYKGDGWFAGYTGIQRMIFDEIEWDVFSYGGVDIDINDFSASNMSNLYYFSKTGK